MGYNFGSWVSDNALPQTISSRQLDRYIRKDIIGNFIWNRIRIQYKMMINEKDHLTINNAIDNAFITLKYVNYVADLYKSRRRLLS